MGIMSHLPERFGTFWLFLVLVCNLDLYKLSGSTLSPTPLCPTNAFVVFDFPGPRVEH